MQLPRYSKAYLNHVKDTIKSLQDGGLVETKEQKYQLTEVARTNLANYMVEAFARPISKEEVSPLLQASVITILYASEEPLPLEIIRSRTGMLYFLLDSSKTFDEILISDNRSSKSHVIDSPSQSLQSLPLKSKFKDHLFI